MSDHKRSRMSRGVGYILLMVSIAGSLILAHCNGALPQQGSSSLSQDQVLAGGVGTAYLRFWRVYSEASVTLRPSDPRPVMAGIALHIFTREIARHRLLDQPFR